MSALATTPLETELDDVLKHLRAFRFDTSTEDTFQLAVARALHLRGAAFEREVRLSARDRIDFLLGGGIGLELKINGAPSEVTRQLLRYAESEKISALVLVTTRALHRAMPAVLLGKPLRVHWQGGIG